jgi:hypothetical protein
MGRCAVTPHADDELLTMQEVADVVRVPVATLRYWRTDVFAWLDDQANSDR